MVSSSSMRDDSDEGSITSRSEWPKTTGKESLLSHRAGSACAARGLSQLQNWMLHLSYYEHMLGVHQWNHGMKRHVMVQFLFPGNIDFAADDQVVLSCCIHEGLMCLIIFCEKMFTIGESQAISHSNDPEQQAQQVVGNPRRRRFSTETSLENAD